MILIFTVLVTLGLVYARICAHKNRYSDTAEAATVITTLGVMLGVITAMVLFALSVHYSYTDERIDIHIEENEKIIEEIDTLVLAYCEHEYLLYTKITQDNVSLVAVMYPELNSHALIQAQIQVIIDNNRQIKQFKEDLVNKKAIDWWLYFGG